MSQQRSRTKSWSELSPVGKAFVIGAVVLHLGLVGVVHGDLAHRPAEQIRGPKGLWYALSLANTSFSVVYLGWARRKPAE